MKGVKVNYRKEPQLLFRVFILGFLLQSISAVTFGRTEFLGPFPSWRNVKADYGAKGDGIIDDTAAVQFALDALIKHKDFCVLYFPEGIYRITRTIQTVRKAHTDCQGVAIVGEHPQTTRLKWDGPKGGTLFRWDAWYSYRL